MAAQVWSQVVREPIVKEADSNGGGWAGGGSESDKALSLLGRPRVRGWHMQNFTQFVPASHLLAHCLLAEQARDIFTYDAHAQNNN